MIEAWALLSPKNVLQLGAIFANRERAERALRAEFPAGHPIYPAHRIVKIRIELDD